MQIDDTIQPQNLDKALARMFELARSKVRAIRRPTLSKGAPVITVNGKYTNRGWTDWTQGFQFGCAILTADATDDQELLEMGRRDTATRMTPHVTHVGVHDHGFNNISTYGNLRRLMREGKLTHNEWELAFYEMALKASGAVQAARWTGEKGEGYIYSFNGPHSLFIDTIRTLRSLALAHQLGHMLIGENDCPINLLERLISHARHSARYNIYYGEERDVYDVPGLPGRTAHEAIFNIKDGQFRCPNSQQGYSPFTTWTRGLAWAMLGFTEQLEFLKSLQSGFNVAGIGNQADVLTSLLKPAVATCDFYLTYASAGDGICYWDTGAPSLHKLGDWRSRPADPYNDHEPVDASASVIAAQGLLRLGRYLGADGAKYTQAGLTIARSVLSQPYLAMAESHEGLLLHCVYHRPNGWDHVPQGRKVPCGEACMWGDYHLLELGVYLKRLIRGENYLTFFDQKK